jgi:hypothetical protein
VSPASSSTQTVAIAPSGERTRWNETDSVRSLALREQGFYEIRDADAVAARRIIAVNPNTVESELGSFPEDELVRAVTTPSANATTTSTVTTLSIAEREQRQTMWWYVLVLALLLLGAESLLSNRLSRGARRDFAPGEGRMKNA